MSFQEWYVLKSYLEKHGITKFREDSTLALLPTVTKISRRALFSGKKEYEIPLKRERDFQILSKKIGNARIRNKSVLRIMLAEIESGIPKL